VPARALVVTPAARGSRSGNRTTALRIAALLRRCGPSVGLRSPATREPADLLVAVHAVKSRDCVLAHQTAQPDRHRVVLLAGTDIYPDFAPEPATLAALQAASAIVALQPLAVAALPAALRTKARTIVQSAVAATATARPSDHFAVCVLAHLRAIKQPLLPFAALAMVDRNLSVRVTLAGRALDPELATAASAWSRREPRATYCGELDRLAARRLIASSHLLVVPSAAEGGANVVSEAIAAGTPVVATSVPGNLGLLGADWPGLFAPGDAAGLAALLTQLASDPVRYADLVQRTRSLQDRVAVATELAAWRQLLQDLGLSA
jgi:putative glycosyltransferase (TIGR04348 family)